MLYYLYAWGRCVEVYVFVCVPVSVFVWESVSFYSSFSLALFDSAEQKFPQSKYADVALSEIALFFAGTLQLATSREFQSSNNYSVDSYEKKKKRSNKNMTSPRLYYAAIVTKNMSHENSYQNNFLFTTRI